MQSETVGECDHCGAAIERAHQTAACPSCGQRLSVEINRRLDNPESRKVLADRGILPYEVEEEAPAAAGPPAPRGQETAGFIIRGVARIIDAAVGVVVSIPSTVLAFLLLTILGTPGAVTDWVERLRELSATAVIFSIVGSTLYSTFCEWIGGATVGKLACGLRVITAERQPLSFRAAFVRSAAFLVDGLFFGFVAYLVMQHDELNQRYGDRWAGTIVVRERDVPGGGQGIVRLLLGVVVGCAIWGALQAYVSVSQVLTS